MVQILIKAEHLGLTVADWSNTDSAADSNCVLLHLQNKIKIATCSLSGTHQVSGSPKIPN